MANDDATIGNRALAKIGTRTTISGLADGSNEANQLNLIYNDTRDEVLSMAMWNFARKQIVLTQIGSAQDGTALTPWAYEYSYPSNCVHMRYILPLINTAPDGSIPIFSGATQVPSDNFFNAPPVPFLVASDEEGAGNDINVILTNQYQAQAVFTGRITSPTLFSAAFTQAFVSVLGARIAIPLTGDKELAKGLYKEANDYIIQARVSDGNEGLTIQDHLPDWLAIRGYAQDFAMPGYFLAPYPPLYPVS